MRSRIGEVVRTHEARLAGIIVVFAGVFAVLSPGFRTWGNFQDLLDSQAVLAVMAAGLLVVLIAGGIDVSFAAIAAVSQYVVALAMLHGVGNWLLAFALAIAVGGFLGGVNALLVHWLKAPPVIVTIAMMSFYFSLLLTATHGAPLYDLPDWFTDKFSPAGIPFPIAVAGMVLVGTALLLSRLSLGRQIYALGGNPEAARRMGSPIALLQCFVYGFSGAMAAIAGLLQAHRVDEVVPNALVGRELDVLAAVVLGGASLNGGIGSVSGTVLGVVLLAVLRNGLTLIGVSSYWFGAVTGLVILVSVSASALAGRGRGKRGARAAG